MTPLSGSPGPISDDPRPATEPALELLDRRRDRAERMLNGVRAAVLLLLTTAALIYAPTLTRALNRTNVLLLLPALAWTVGQYALFYRRRMLPGWLAVANPVIDISMVTTAIAAYALVSSAVLAVKSPIFLAYFVILAALPVAAATRTAMVAAVLVVLQYGGLLAFFVLSDRLPLAESPVAAIATGRISPLDEGARLLLLAVAGAVATYATSWQEGLATGFEQAAREREQLVARLERAQLQSLKLQLHPHFLFNTLNTITALINTDRHAAERVVSGLSDLLRMSLSNVGEQEVPLARELELLGHYIDIQQIRFQDRLRVSFQIDADTRSALVPNLLLQPLVENAIRHGIAPRASKGHVEVGARRRNGGGMLELWVVDDGVGEDPRAVHRDGVGLGNTRARLRSLYGGDHRFEASGKPNEGFTVRMEIPFRVVALAPAGGTGAAHD
jgi:two-component system, LytTR family, sensor kinase